MNNVWILAQAPGAGAQEKIDSREVNEQLGTKEVVESDANDLSKQPPPRPFNPMQIGIFVLMFVVMYFLLFRAPRKKQQQRRQMVESLQKNDRVLTAGGIIGTVVDIRDDEITLKVDESNNTKMKFTHSAITRNLSQDSK